MTGAPTGARIAETAFPSRFLARLQPRSLRGCRLRHQPELGHDLYLVEVEVFLGDLVACDPEELCASALELPVRRGDLTRRTDERVRMRPLNVNWTAAQSPDTTSLWRVSRASGNARNHTIA